MQKLDMNTVAQGIKRDFNDVRTEFALFIDKNLSKIVYHELPALATGKTIIHYPAVLGNFKN